MDDKLRQLTAKKQKLDAFKPLPQELIDNLEDWFRVELTYSSNAIEGNILTRVETAEVLERGVTAVISGKPLKDQLEALSHAKALEPARENKLKISEPLPEQRFYTTAEVASILQVDPESVRRYVRSNKLRAVKLGGKFIRIEKADLDKFIEQLKT